MTGFFLVSEEAVITERSPASCVLASSQKKLKKVVRGIKSFARDGEPGVR